MAAAVEDSPSTSCLSETLKLLRSDNLKNHNADVQEFKNRIKTYILGQKWVKKPFALSPPVCARFGWECRGPNKLQCVSCSAVLCASLPEMENCRTYDKSVECVLNSLKSNHTKHCPWPHAPCPENFFRMFPVCKKAAFEDFVSRLESLLPIEKILPQVKDSVAEALELSEDHFKALCKQSHVSDSPFTRSSILLAATGWRRAPDAGKTKYITCVNCERTVGVWFYMPVQCKVTEECIPKQEAETSELLSPPHISSETTQDASPSSNGHTSEECNDRNGSTATSAPRDSQEVLCKQEISTNSESPVRQNGKRPTCDDSSCVSEDQPPPRKKLCLETNKPFDPLYEHRPWCMWISKTSSTNISPSSTGDVESPGCNDRSVPGYKVYIECLLKNVENSLSCPSPLSSPTKEQLNKARELLTTWSSPT